MNSGSIHRDTAAGRVYRILRSRPGHAFDAWELARMARTTCISTRISEVRAQAPAGETIPPAERRRVEVETEDGGTETVLMHFYRLELEPPSEGSQFLLPMQQEREIA